MSPDTSIAALRKAVRAAKVPEQRAAALGLVLGATERDSPDEAEIWCLAGRLHRDSGDTAGALDAFARGEMADDKAHRKAPAWTCAEHAKLLLKAGRPDEAMAVAERGIASGRSSPGLLAVLGQAAIKRCVAVEQAEPILREAILANPADRRLVEGWFDRLRAEGSAETASRWLEALQDESQTLLYGLLSALAEIDGLEAVRRRFATRFEAVAGQEPFVKFARAWQAVIEDRAPDEVDLVAAERSPADVETFFRFVRPAPEQLALFEDPAAQARLADVGVHVKALRAFAAGLRTVSNPIWRAILDDATITGESARRRLRTAEDAGAVVERIAATGTLAMMDPFTGQLVEPFDSCVASGRPVYSFRGRELFHLICDGLCNEALGLYVPRHNLSIQFTVRPSKPTGDLTAGAQSALLVYSASMGERMAKMLSKLFARYARHQPTFPTPHLRGNRRRLILSVLGIENFAHQVWNHYSAIERLIVTDRVKYFSAVMVTGSEFFGPLDELFPELATVGVVRLPRSSAVDPCPFDPNALVLRAGGFFVPTRLTRRIIDAMTCRPRVSRDIPEPNDFPQAARMPVFWFGLRLRDKAWVDQEEGVTRIIRILADKHPDALFLLDGFSHPVGIDLVSEKWQDVTTALKAMAARIKAASGVPGRVIDMVGNTLRESVLWAQVTDAYLTPYGTTQHKVGWFSKAPGLAYLSATTDTPEGAARSAACSAVEYSPPPEFIFADAVSWGERRGISRQYELSANVSLDVASLAERLDAMIAGQARAV